VQANAPFAHEDPVHAVRPPIHGIALEPYPRLPFFISAAAISARSIALIMAEALLRDSRYSSSGVLSYTTPPAAWT
jgi:hypothetical protein